MRVGSRTLNREISGFGLNTNGESVKILITSYSKITFYIGCGDLGLAGSGVGWGVFGWDN